MVPPRSEVADIRIGFVSSALWRSVISGMFVCVLYVIYMDWLSDFRLLKKVLFIRFSCSRSSEFVFSAE